MATQKDIDAAVDKERERCAALLDLYRDDFNSSSDRMMASLWCRIRNQISMGVKPDESDFGEQLADVEEDLDDRDV